MNGMDVHVGADDAHDQEERRRGEEEEKQSVQWARHKVEVPPEKHCGRPTAAIQGAASLAVAPPRPCPHIPRLGVATSLLLPL